jgi:ferredoxin
MKTSRTSPRDLGTRDSARRPSVADGRTGMSDLALGIDRITCDGYGSCAELLPEMIELDDWGYPIIRPGPVPAVLLGHARMAVDTCPVLALRLEAVARATMTPATNTAATAVRAGGPARAANR